MDEFDEFKDPVMRKQIIEKLKIAEEQIEKGEVIPMEAFFREMREKYGYRKI